MTDTNSVVIAGRLTKPAEYKQFQSGSGVFNLSIASNHSVKDQSGSWKETPSFFDVKYFTKSQGMAPYLQKGVQVVIQGALSQERWQGQDGKSQSKIVINASNVQLVGGRSDNSNQQSQSNYQPQMNQQPQFNSPVPTDGGFTEDIPF